ncbi:MAG: CtsR family transcriptional regulator [Clostridia bacterium]|jgi:transcriptional regulator CtsR|nr:CtsR family transcriptional regulator [Clostridia bacterium]MDD4275665.1 CtsR family transcriptional regulator [Clostridia bacterium]
MDSISNLIENFIISTIGEEKSLDLSRNELGKYFGCAPSQINYVISTRFTVERGFITESKRGGGGFIKITKLSDRKDSFISSLINNVIGEQIDYNRAVQILIGLKERQYVTERELEIIKIAIHPKSLQSPLDIAERQRAVILKNLLIYF